MLTDRKDVLDRLAAGEISADEAARLLVPARSTPSKPVAPSSRRWLHVRVSDLQTGKQRVSVNLPLTWVELGLKLGGQFTPEIAGLDFGEIVQMLDQVEDGRIVEVEDLDDDERVEIYID